MSQSDKLTMSIFKTITVITFFVIAMVLGCSTETNNSSDTVPVTPMNEPDTSDTMDSVDSEDSCLETEFEDFDIEVFEVADDADIVGC